MAIAPLFNWTMIPDTADWIYGRLADYFVPPPITCTLPAKFETENKKKYPEFGTDGWQNASRLRLTRNPPRIATLERLVRDVSIDTNLTRELKEQQALWRLDEEHTTLPYGASVPAGVVPAFLAQAKVLEEIWVPTPGMQGWIDRLRERLGLNDTSVATRRPVIA